MVFEPTPYLLLNPARADVLNFILNGEKETLAEYTNSSLGLSPYAEPRILRVSKALSFGHCHLRSLEIAMACSFKGDLSKKADGTLSCNLSTLEQLGAHSQLQNLRISIRCSGEDDEVADLKTLFEASLTTLARGMVPGPAKLTSEIEDDDMFDERWILCIERRAIE